VYRPKPLSRHGNIKVVTTLWCAFTQVDIVPSGQPYCLFSIGALTIHIIAEIFRTIFLGMLFRG